MEKKKKRLMHFVQTPSASCRSWLICRDIFVEIQHHLNKMHKP